MNIKRMLAYLCAFALLFALTGIRYMEKCAHCGKEQENSRAPGRHTWGSTAEYWNNWTHILTCTICGATKDEDHSLSGNYCSACDSHIIN